MKKLLFATSILLAISNLVHSQPKLGEEAYEISLADINGKTQTLSSLKGKVVLVDFWASWCVPCRKANKELNSLYARYKKNGFEILSISIDDESADWKKAVKADKMKWLQVNQQGGWEAPVAAKWKIEEIPASWLIDKDGKVIAISPQVKEIEAYLEKLLP